MILELTNMKVFLKDKITSRSKQVEIASELSNGDFTDPKFANNVTNIILNEYIESIQLKDSTISGKEEISKFLDDEENICERDMIILASTVGNKFQKMMDEKEAARTEAEEIIKKKSEV